MYLSSQLFVKTPHKTLKFRKQSKENAYSTDQQTYISNIFPLVTEPLN